MMFDGNLVVCKKCRNQAGFTSFINVTTEKCDYCGGDLIDTGKTEDEWDELFERCSDPNKGTAPWEWAAEQVLKNSSTTTKGYTPITAHRLKFMLAATFWKWKPFLRFPL